MTNYNFKYKLTHSNEIHISTGVPGFPSIRVRVFRGWQKVEVSILRFPKVRLLKEKQFLTDNYEAITAFLLLVDALVGCASLDEAVAVISTFKVEIGGEEYEVKGK